METNWYEFYVTYTKDGFVRVAASSVEEARKTVLESFDFDNPDKTPMPGEQVTWRIDTAGHKRAYYAGVLTPGSNPNDWGQQAHQDDLGATKENKPNRAKITK